MIFPAGFQIFTRTIGSRSTERRSSLSIEAIARGSPRSSAGVMAGATTPSPASLVVCRASRIASLFAGVSKESDRQEAEQEQGTGAGHGELDDRAGGLGPLHLWIESPNSQELTLRSGAWKQQPRSRCSPIPSASEPCARRRSSTAHQRRPSTA